MVVFVDSLQISFVVDELDFIEIVTKCLCVDSCPMATSTNSSTDINLDHDDVGFVLIVVLNTPPPHLVIADTSSNLDKMLPHLIAL
jgi:hypothetical protein